jgi:hypothetical protein
LELLLLSLLDYLEVGLLEVYYLLHRLHTVSLQLLHQSHPI